MTNKLLPCPFCGEKVTESFMYIDDRSPSHSWHLEHWCNSNLCIVLRRLTRKELVETWNKRNKNGANNT